MFIVLLSVVGVKVKRLYWTYRKGYPTYERKLYQWRKSFLL